MNGCMHVIIVYTNTSFFENKSNEYKKLYFIANHYLTTNVCQQTNPNDLTIWEGKNGGNLDARY